MPVVNMWLESPVADEFPGFFPGYHKAGQMAAEHLIGRGFSRLAYFGFAQTRAEARQYQGILDAARDHGYQVSHHQISRFWDERKGHWIRLEDAVLKAQVARKGAVRVRNMTDELARAVSAIFLGRIGRFWKSWRSSARATTS